VVGVGIFDRRVGLVGLGGEIAAYGDLGGWAIRIRVE